MELGEMINTEYDLVKSNVYNAFVAYYKNPTMTKIKDVGSYSMYMVKVYSMIGNAYRYLIVFLEKNEEEKGSTKLLEDCDWVSLQTRTLEDYHELPVIRYDINKTLPLNQKIVRKTHDEKLSTYEAENFPLMISLLHTNKNMYQYQPSGTIISALETFQTIVNFSK